MKNTKIKKLSDKSIAKLGMVLATMPILANINMAFAAPGANDGIDTVIEFLAGEVYKQISSLSTVVAGASIALALLVGMFSHDEKAIGKTKMVAKALSIMFVALKALPYAFNWIDSMLPDNAAAITGSATTIIQTFLS